MPPRPTLAWTLLLAALGSVLPADAPKAQRLLDWRGGASAPTSAPSTPPPRLTLRRDGAALLAEVGNPLAGPVQVRLLAPNAAVRAVPALPVAARLAAYQRQVLARLYPDDAAPEQRVDVALELVPGDPRGRADDVVYRLPFDAPARVDQGFEGRFSHHDDANRYALDFALAAGTPVLAARAGVVMELQRGVTAHGASADAGGGNLVRVLHADGSMAVYAHLSAQGLAVVPGQQVAAGQLLGHSGNSGFSTAPHLHFAVQLNRGLHLASVPFRMAGPLGELRFPRAEAP
jgi:murein DD-endopeptidase MepM/ murein hydrolase activator NlpD